jgi:hypothetical protein
MSRKGGKNGLVQKCRSRYAFSNNQNNEKIQRKYIHTIVKKINREVGN